MPKRRFTSRCSRIREPTYYSGKNFKRDTRMKNLTVVDFNLCDFNRAVRKDNLSLRCVLYDRDWR